MLRLRFCFSAALQSLDRVVASSKWTALIRQCRRHHAWVPSFRLLLYWHSSIQALLQTIWCFFGVTFFFSRVSNKTNCKTFRNEKMRMQSTLITSATKSQSQKIVCLFSQIMKRPQTKFHADTMSDSKLLKSRSKLPAAQFFLFIDILLKLQQHILTCFFKFIWNSEIIQMGWLRLLTV